MKYVVIFIFGLISGYTLIDAFKANNSYQQDIGQPKSVKVNKERYFFVGYSINNGKQTATGSVQWFTHDGLMPIKKELFDFLKKDMAGFQFSFDQLVIMGLYEFKDESECTFFFNCQKIKQ